MTLFEWRQNKRRMKSAAQVLENPVLREMIQTLHVSSPLYFQSRNLQYGAGVTPQDHSRMLGLIEGYALALDFLESLGKPLPEPASQILPRFEPPEQT